MIKHATTPRCASVVSFDTRFDHLLTEKCPDYLVEKLLTKNRFKTAAECHTHFAELMKYMYLNLKYGVPIAMTSSAVDTVWHEFILFLSDYLAFCREKMGKIFYHEPSTSKRPVHSKATENFFALYETEFGDLPEVWRAEMASCQRTIEKETDLQQRRRG